MKHWINKNYRTLIVLAFLVPIIIVAVVSISHVTQWYGVSNPITWAIYLSVGIEIAAMSALAALTANVGKHVYLPFIIVTLIQFMGNVFFSYEFIDIAAQTFLSWVELVSPVLQFIGIEATNLIAHKRFLALISGGMLPIISLSFLHMLVVFTEEGRLEELKGDATPINSESTEEPVNLMEEKDKIEKEDKLNISDEQLEKIGELFDKKKPKSKYKDVNLLNTDKEEQEKVVETIEKLDSEPDFNERDFLSDYPEFDNPEFDEMEEEDINDYIKHMQSLAKSKANMHKPKEINPKIKEDSWESVRDEVLNDISKEEQPKEVEKKNL